MSAQKLKGQITVYQITNKYLIERRAYEDRNGPESRWENGELLGKFLEQI